MSFEADIETAKTVVENLLQACSFYADFEESGHSDWTMATDSIVAFFGQVPAPGEKMPKVAALDRLAAEHERLRGGLRRIAYEMPVQERNPDGDEQAAYSMHLVARDLLAETAL